MQFHGDLIITDPGYVAKDAEDWKKCGYGDHMEKLGLSTVLSALVTEGEEDLCGWNPNDGSCYGTLNGFRGGIGLFAGGNPFL